MDVASFIVVGGTVAVASWTATKYAYGSDKLSHTTTNSSPAGAGHLLLLRSLCVVLFTSSALMLLLVLCELLQLVDPVIRTRLWMSLSGTLLFVLGFVCPAIQLLRLVHHRIVPTVILYIAYLAAFHLTAAKIPTQVDETPDNSIVGWYRMRQELLACISCVGITAMAALCGVSSVSTPYTAFISPESTCSEADIRRLEQSIEATREEIATKELQMQRLRLEEVNFRARKNKSATNLVGMIVSSFRNDDVFSQLMQLQNETDSLTLLGNEFLVDLHNAQEQMRCQEYQKTLLGRIRKVGYSLFAVYCSYRLFNTMLRMGWWLAIGKETLTSEEDEIKHKGPRDAIVYMLATHANYWYPAAGVDGWQRVIGAMVSGGVFAAALSGVLRTMNRLLKRFRQSVMSSLDPLLVAQIVGVYALSIVGALRLNLPRSMSGPISAALASPLKPELVQLLNDSVFCASSCAVILLLWTTHSSGKEEDDIELQKVD